MRARDQQYVLVYCRPPCRYPVSEGLLETRVFLETSNVVAEIVVNAAGGNLTISWPDTASGFILESSATMATGSWSTVTAGQTDSNGTISVTVPISGARQFFRLRHP